ncbi:MAG: hypothetical protein WD431_01510, partial [Cyclobacteriaceae bacterium]
MKETLMDFKRIDFIGHALWVGFILAGIVAINPPLQILSLPYIVKIPCGRVQNIDKIFHKKARLGNQPGSTLVGVAG